MARRWSKSRIPLEGRKGRGAGATEVKLEPNALASGRRQRRRATGVGGVGATRVGPCAGWVEPEGGGRREEGRGKREEGDLRRVLLLPVGSILFYSVSSARFLLSGSQLRFKKK